MTLLNILKNEKKMVMFNKNCTTSYAFVILQEWSNLYI